MINVHTADGDVYHVEQRLTGFYKLAENDKTLVAFVGDKRVRLCEDALEGKREIFATLDPANRPAIGFSDSEATLNGTPPREGFRMFIVDAEKVIPTRLTEPIERLS